MKTAYFSCGRACSFREQHDRIAFFRHTPYKRFFRLILQGQRETIQLTRHGMEYRVVPNIIFHHDSYLGRLRQDKHDIEVRLMVRDNYRWLFTQLDVTRIVDGIIHTANSKRRTIVLRQALHLQAIAQTALRRIAAYREIEQGVRRDK